MAFTGIILWGFFIEADDSLKKATERSAFYVIQTENVRSFIDTGNRDHLYDKPFLHIPYPLPDRLEILLLDESIVSILHPDVTGKNSQIRNNKSLFIPNLFTKYFRYSVSFFRNLSFVFISLGILMFFINSYYSIIRIN